MEYDFFFPLIDFSSIVHVKDGYKKIAYYLIYR